MARFKNLHELILAAGARYRNKVVFRHVAQGRVRSFKYGELAKWSYRLAEAFWARGLRAGDYVAIWADNSPEWMLAALAALRLGIIVVPLDSRSKASEVMPVIDKVHPKLVLVGRKQYVRIHERLEPEKLALIDELSAPVDTTKPASAPDLANVKESDPALIVFTSGTSGASKGVVLTHGNIVANVIAVAKSFDVTEDDRLLSILPLSHMLEFTAGCIGPLHKGATITYSQIKGASHLKELLKVEKVSVFLATPMVFQALNNAIKQEIEKLPKVKQLAFAAMRKLAQANPAIAPLLFKNIHDELGHNIKFWVAGGAPIPVEIVEDLGALGIRLLTGYGLTEASPIVSANTRDKDRPGSVGRPLPGVEVMIERQSDDEGEGKSGEILVRGASVMSHYFENPQETEKVLKNGWLHTGDSGYIDKEGYIFITGRMKSMIVTSGGYNIFPEELEEVLSKSTAIKEVSVFGRKGANGEEAYAVIVPQESLQARPDLEARIKEEVNLALSELADYKRLAGYQIWKNDLPRTGIGKIRRGEVARLFELQKAEDTEQASPVEGVNWDEDGKLVLRILGDVMEPEVLAGLSPSGSRLFSPSANLSADLGLDSFARLELTCKLEESFGIALEEDALQDVQSVEDLVLAVKGARRLCATRLAGAERCLDEEAVTDAVSVASKPWPREWTADRTYPLRDGILMVSARRALGIGLKTFLKIYNNFESEGADRLLLDPPFIVCANHTSHFDTAAILTAFPSALLKFVHPVAAADYWFNTPLQAKLSAYVLNAVPFERYGNFEESMQECEELLREGQILIIFPEGKRSLDGSIGQFKPGAARLAIQTGCPVVPAFIEGCYQALPKGKSVLQPAKVKVKFGLPIYPNPGNADLKACQELTRRVRDSIVLLGEENSQTQEIALGQSK